MENWFCLEFYTNKGQMDSLYANYLIFSTLKYYRLFVANLKLQKKSIQLGSFLSYLYKMVEQDSYSPSEFIYYVMAAYLTNDTVPSRIIHL